MRTVLFILLFTLPFLLSAQWSPARFDQKNQFEKTLAIDEDNVFLVGRDPISYKNFFMRTSNGGMTWDSIGVYPFSMNYEFNSLYFVNNLVGFIGGSKNNKQLLIKTNDGGTTWTEITPDTTNPIISIHFVDAMNGFAIDSWDRMYSTTDGGQTWTTTLVLEQFRDVHFMTNTVGYASGSAQWSDAALLKTMDGGQTWTTLLTDRDWNLFVSSFDKMDVVDANTIFTYMSNTNRLYKTVNGGATWDTIVVSGIDYIGDIDFVSADTGHLLSLNGEIFITVDGGQTWTLEYATTWGVYGPNVYLYSLSFVGETGYVGGSNGLIKKHSVMTSLKQINKEENNFKLYPNPYSNNQNLVMELANPIENGLLQISNAVGQIVYQKTVQNTTTSLTLSEVKLNAGLYVITLKNNTKITSQTLLVK